MNSEMQPRTCPQCGTTSPSEHLYCAACGFPIGTVTDRKGDAFVGQTLPGGYHILDLISVGGMGRVYRAEQSVLGRTVAVKIIHPHLLADENAALRFLTEARAASQLNHPNSIAVYDFGRTPQGQPYLVMEFLKGKDLARVVHEEGLLPLPRIVNVLTQVLSALSDAHDLGIIHRDLKPENVILEPLRRGGDFVKVLDFGLAKLRADARAPTGVTSPGIVCGTPDYMAPEQGRGDPIDGRSDLYSVGIMLFQLLTGRLPFEADSPTQVVMMHLTVPPPDPRELARHRHIPDCFAEVVFKALRKEAAARYQDAIEFSDGLKEALALAESHPPVVRGSLLPTPSVQPNATVTCNHCGLVVPAGRYCIECSARLPTDSQPPVQSGRVQLPLVMLDRDEDWQWLTLRFESSARELAAGRLVAEAGAGKSRLIHEFLRHVEAQGALVVITGPDPSWAEIPNFALNDTIQQLGVVDSDTLSRQTGDSMPPPALFGLQEVLETPLSTEDHREALERRLARVEALRWAICKAYERFAPERIVLAVDDLHRIDAPSRDAIADLVSDRLDVPLLVLCCHPPTFDASWSARHPARVLGGISMASAKRLLQSAHAEIPPSALSGDFVLPLFVDQLLRFSQEGGIDPSPRLADLVAQRIDVLPPEARRALQAIAMMGDRVDPALLAEFVPKTDDLTSAVQLLEQRGMLWVADGQLNIDHPLLREVVIAAIPAAVRRELYARTLAVSERQHTALETRAQLAYYAEDSVKAMLLLEQVAEGAAMRGDARAEILALRRGLELARKEISRGELDDPLQAVLIFSRKLGAALTRSGDFSDAEGILREALDYATPSSSERARLLGALAHVARGRDRASEAIGYIDKAIEAALYSGAQDLVAVFNNTRNAWGA